MYNSWSRWANDYTISAIADPGAAEMPLFQREEPKHLETKQYILSELSSLEEDRLEIERRRHELEEEKQDSVRRRRAQAFMFAIYAIVTLSTLVLIFLQGFAVVDLPTEVLVGLSAAAFGEVAIILGLIYRNLFRD